jgi:hypothetical protein
MRSWRTAGDLDSSKSLLRAHWEWPAWAQPVAAFRATNGEMPGLLKEDL